MSTSLARLLAFDMTASRRSTETKVTRTSFFTILLETGSLTLVIDTMSVCFISVSSSPSLTWMKSPTLPHMSSGDAPATGHSLSDRLALSYSGDMTAKAWARGGLRGSDNESSRLKMSAMSLELEAMVVDC